MANINETATYSPNIYQLDLNDPVLGGTPEFDMAGNPTTGYSNAPIKQLADRTAYLKTQVDTAFDDITAFEQDLANATDLAKGAGLVGFHADGDGAVPLTVRDALGLASVDLLTRIPKAEWAAIAARTSTFDCTPALADCVSTGKRVTISMPGRYHFATAYAGFSDFDVEATCTGVEFDLSTVAAPQVITNSGNLVQIQELGANVVKGTCTATFASPPSLSPGDWFCIYNPTDSSYSGFRANYRAGEWKQVLSISGNVVTTTQAFYAGYTISDVDVYRMDSVKSRLANIHLIGGPVPTGLVRFEKCSGPVFENITFEHANNSALSLGKCVGGVIVRPQGRNIGDGGDDYGVVIGNCQHTRIYGGDVYSRRHAVVLGGDANVCCVPVRDFRCVSATLRNDPNSSVGAADMHGNTEDSSYTDCDIYGGANIAGGGENYYVNCRIHGPQTVGWGAYYRELKGGRNGFVGCKFYIYVNPQPSGRGIIDCGAQSGVLTEHTVDDTTIVVKGCEVTSTALSNTTSFVLARNMGCVKKVNLEVDGITFNVNALFAVAYLRFASGTADSAYQIVTNISGLPATPGQFFLLSEGGYQAFPMRVQKQTGIVAAVTNGTTSVLTGHQNYPRLYSKVPSSRVAVRGLGGVPRTTFGGQPGTCHAREVTTTRRALSLTTPAATTSGTDFEFLWEVELSEC